MIADLLDMAEAALLEVEGLETGQTVLRAMTLHNLALVYETQGEYMKAIEHYRASIDIWEMLGPENRYYMQHTTQKLLGVYERPGYERTPEFRARLKRRCGLPLDSDDTPNLRGGASWVKIISFVVAMYFSAILNAVLLKPIAPDWVILVSVLTLWLLTWLWMYGKANARLEKLLNNGASDSMLLFFQFWKDK